MKVRSRCHTRKDKRFKVKKEINSFSKQEFPK
jgi:hypothetical protein